MSRTAEIGLATMATLAVAGLLACGSNPCRDGFIKNINNQCIPGGEETGSTGETGGGTGDWVTLPVDCSDLGTITEDPLHMLDRPEEGEPEHGDPFYEMLDLAHAPNEDRMYAVGQGGLIVWDLLESSILGTYPPDGHSRYHQVELLDDGLVAVAHRDRGVEIIDVSGDPSSYSVEHSWPLAGASGMAWSPPYLYVTSQRGILLTLEFKDGTVTPLSTVEGLSSPWELVIDGDRGWISDNTLGVVSVDLSDPSKPEVVDSTQTIGGALDIVHHISSNGEHVLYVATGSTGVEVFSIDDAGLPVSENVHTYSTSIVSVAVAEETLWAVGHEDVAVLDISSATSPVPISAEETPGFGMHVEAEGSTGWVADWGHLAIYEVNALLKAPSIDPSIDSILIGSSNEALISIGNRGGGTLDLLGAKSDDPRVTVLSSTDSVPSGGTSELIVLFEDDGLPLETSICLASNDPDNPTLIFTVAEQSDIQSSVGYGEDAPDFALTDLDGTTYRLSEHLGFPVVLIYFATW